MSHDVLKITKDLLLIKDPKYVQIAINLVNFVDVTTTYNLEKEL